MTTPFVDSSALTVTADDQVKYASALIRAYCRWHIAPQLVVTDETLDCNGDRVLLLPTLHLVSVESVTLNDGSGTVLATGDVSWAEAGMLVRRDGCRWPSGYGAVTVDFTHGYDTTPDDIAEVCVAVAKRLPAQLASVAAESAGGVTRQYGGLLGPHAALTATWTAPEEMVLAKYRLDNRP